MLDNNDFIYDDVNPAPQDDQTQPDVDVDVEAMPQDDTDMDSGAEGGEDQSTSFLLADSLSHFLGDIVTMYSIVHGYHWNVKGKDFKEFHAFFDDIQGEIYESQDRIAEYIVALGYDAPYFPSDFAALTCFQGIDRITSGDIIEMVQSILSMNIQMVEETVALFDLATAAKQNGIANFLADLQDYHTKLGWQLRATLGMH
jgi:starvation-inducible DNA-binding protein